MPGPLQARHGSIPLMTSSTRFPAARRGVALPVPRLHLRRRLGLTLLALATAAPAWSQQLPLDMNSGPIRLRQPLVSNDPREQRQVTGQQPQDNVTLPQRGGRDALPPYQPGEFELFVQRLAAQVNANERAILDRGLPPQPSAAATENQQPGSDRFGAGERSYGNERNVQTSARAAEPTPPPVRRFGAELMTRAEDPDSADFSPQVPPDYLVKNGDEIVVTLWGSVDADVRAVVDRSGRINIPRVGPVLVAGVRYAELPEVLRRRVGQVFRNFDLSVSLGQLRGVRVYVSGFVARPGAYSVSSLSTVLSSLLRAGGPSAAGSFRNITLRRGKQVVASYDLYDFLLKGDRSADALVQPDDVIHVNAVGPQVGVIGSINRPAIFELKSGETVADVMAMAGGYTAVADRSRLAVERLQQRVGERINELPMPQSGSLPLSHGDVLRAFSAVSAQLSVQQQNKRVRVEGEVARPGEYVLPANSSVADALRAAGGLSPSAYVFGTELSRESVRRTQQENYERALRDMETDFVRTTATLRTSTADEAAAQSARMSATTRLVERLRSVQPSGRIVLQMTPDATTLPDLTLEDGDRLNVPPRPSSVGVFGSVFNAGSYLWNNGRSIEEYLQQAGGPTRGADKSSVFVVRANGSVVSALQEGSWFRTGTGLERVRAEPGDTIFVPELQNKTTFIQSAKDWTQILYQFGLGAAALRTIRN